MPKYILNFAHLRLQGYIEVAFNSTSWIWSHVQYVGGSYIYVTVRSNCLSVLMHYVCEKCINGSIILGKMWLLSDSKFDISTISADTEESIHSLMLGIRSVTCSQIAVLIAFNPPTKVIFANFLFGGVRDEAKMEDQKQLSALVIPWCWSATSKILIMEISFHYSRE